MKAKYAALALFAGIVFGNVAVFSQSGGWVWQNNGSSLTTSTPNNGSAVTIWNKNSSGCTLTLKSGASGTVVAKMCGATWTFTAAAIAGVDSLTFSGGQSLVGTTSDVTELYRGASPQNVRIFNTRTDASNGEWFGVLWATNRAVLQTTRNGTGVGRGLALKSAATLELLSNAGDTTGWYIASGHLNPQVTNTYDIGTSGGPIVRAGYFGTVTASTLVSSAAFTFNGTTGKTGTACTQFDVGGCTAATEPNIAYAQLWQPFVHQDIQQVLVPIWQRIDVLERHISELSRKGH